MKIDRHNYEEFFILYLDNELGAEERRAVEAFAQEHADLKEELDMLLQSRMVPDEELVFSDKDSLLKTGGYGTINRNNYEEWFLSYSDNELTEAQQKEVEQFIANHSSLQNELTLLLRAKLEPETIVFPYKESLYRTEEEKVRVISIHWKRYAAAAALLLAVSTTAFFVWRNNNNTSTDTGTEGMAVNTDAPAKANPTNNDSGTIQLPVKKTVEEITGTNDVAVTKETPVTTPVVKDKRVERAPLQDQAAKKQNESLAVNVPEKQDNGLPQPKNNPNVNSLDKAIKSQDNNVIAMTDVPVKDDLTNRTSDPIAANVTSNTGSTFKHAGGIENPDETGGSIANEPGGKNKLRGFFRKLTRTFEKNTNIKATDDEDRLLVGGLAIRL